MCRIDIHNQTDIKKGSESYSAHLPNVINNTKVYTTWYDAKVLVSVLHDLIEVGYFCDLVFCTLCVLITHL